MMKKLSVKNWLSNVISESEDQKSETPNFSSDNVDTVSIVQIKPDKGVITINFVTKDNKELQFKTKDNNFYKWLKTNQETDKNPALGFVIWFLKNHKPAENKIMSEIVDEYNGLIGDEDLPRDSSRMIGLSSKDSTQIYQTRAKGRNKIGGFISW